MRPCTLDGLALYEGSFACMLSVRHETCARCAPMLTALAWHTAIIRNRQHALWPKCEARSVLLTSWRRLKILSPFPSFDPTPFIQKLTWLFLAARHIPALVSIRSTTTYYKHGPFYRTQNLDDSAKIMGPPGVSPPPSFYETKEEN